MSEPTPGMADAEDLPAVDVVIATHNRPELLRVALQAVLDQTYPGTIRVILVFDQTDIDQSLVRDEGNRQVVAIANTRTPGLAGARNSGILAGDAPLVAFCDDDDEWLPTKVARQVETLAASDALTAVTGIVVLYADRQATRIPRAQDMTLEELIRDRVMEAHPSTVMVRRSALLGPIGLVDEEIPGSYGEDYDWIIRAAEAGEIAVVPEALVKVLWGQSLFSQRWQTIIDSIDYSLAKHPRFRDDPQALGRLYGRRAFALASLGERKAALRQAYQAARTNPKERRAYLAAAVALHLVSTQRLMRMAHERGRGI
jgi:glycosyltransferase involved in cell wall biosynthesis